MPTQTRRAAPAPLSKAARYASAQQQERLLRLGACLFIIVLVVVPRVPSPLLGFDWQRAVAPSLVVLAERIPTEPLDLVLLTLAPQPIGRWLAWGVAAFLAFVALTLVMHLAALYAQRTRPLSQPRSYLRVNVPTSAPRTPADAVTLLTSLHGMVPASSPMQPTLAPLLLCWTARPGRPIQQGMSVAGPVQTVTSMQKRLQGMANGAKAVVADDPLLAALQPGRWLCAAEARTVAGTALPIGVARRSHTLLSALLSALVPQAGIVLTSARLVQEPIADRRWRLAVLAALEQGTRELSSEEQQALKAKASGPAFRSRLLLLAIADDPQAGAAQLETLGAALAASVQTLGGQSQRLQLGAVQVLPAVVPPVPRFPAARQRAGLIIGVVLALVLALVLARHGLLAAQPLLWAIPPLVLPLPLLLLAAHWHRRTNAELPRQHAALLTGVLPLRNPRLVPLWWPWLGHTDD